ncbi:MAG: hypothetical protein EP301_12945 [Gammaproteobacteria bacterium]|nr:MAG: hypothetical protein EP301_12945 [Gammaproteobacteria bacterium]
MAAAKRKRGSEPKQEGRMARHLRVGREVVREPRKAIPFAREALVETWRARGGGFYGLGYVIAFCWLQVNVLVGDVSESDSVSQFAMGAAIEYLLRFSLMAFVNVFLALLWPLYVLEQFGGMGIILLALGYLTFEYGLRPLVEQVFPELRGSEMRENASQNQEQ